jgi:hypothetical protein
VYIIQTMLKLIKVAYKLKPTKYKGMIIQNVVTNNIYDVVNNYKVLTKSYRPFDGGVSSSGCFSFWL